MSLRSWRSRPTLRSGTRTSSASSSRASRGWCGLRSSCPTWRTRFWSAPGGKPGEAAATRVRRLPRADMTPGPAIGNHRDMPSQFDPPSGTRDFLAADVERREHAFAVIRSVFSRYGFEPLQTPAFERLDVLLGRDGDESDKLVFKILRRGEHEASGEADLALRYDMTVPLARVAAAYGSQLPMPYKRYAMG